MFTGQNLTCSRLAEPTDKNLVRSCVCVCVCLSYYRIIGSAKGSSANSNKDGFHTAFKSSLCLFLLRIKSYLSQAIHSSFDYIHFVLLFLYVLDAGSRSAMVQCNYTAVACGMCNEVLLRISINAHVFVRPYFCLR